MFPKLRYSAEQIHDYCQLVSTDMVTQSLSKSRCDYFDLLNLLSPAASREIPALRRQATWCRRRHFGKTVSVYAPLYVANTCVNSCKYCDFNIHQQAHRKILTTAEVRRECAAIRQSGIESLLLVAGEDPGTSALTFFALSGRCSGTIFPILRSKWRRNQTKVTAGSLPPALMASPAIRRPTIRISIVSCTRAARNATTSFAFGRSCVRGARASVPSAWDFCSVWRRGFWTPPVSAHTRSS